MRMTPPRGFESGNRISIPNPDTRMPGIIHARGVVDSVESPSSAALKCTAHWGYDPWETPG